ncbi:Hypothetical predicted protein [Cloeon dipterum]|uniref:RRM domain-containing protein n=1 Tax=Cloeon dipterum TaxID=197152 RepID=A0A8S1BZJ0_9INSE|nr:Hypothetical predicted protein [Cloeon dipterum]
MSRHREAAVVDCKVYVGDLGSNASKQELEDAFSYYGPLRNVWVARNPPGFAFVEFEDPRDAEDSVRGLDGRTICGRRVRVEMSNGMSKSRFRGGSSRRGRPFHPEDRCYESAVEVEEEAEAAAGRTRVLDPAHAAAAAAADLPQGLHPGAAPGHALHAALLPKGRVAAQRALNQEAASQILTSLKQAVFRTSAYYDFTYNAFVTNDCTRCFCSSVYSP